VLPPEYTGCWVAEPAQCDVSCLLSIQYEGDEISVSGYEWGANEVEITKEGEFFILDITSLSPDGEFKFKLKVAMDANGNLILDDDSYSAIGAGESTSNKLIKCQ